MVMYISEQGIALIKQCEGFSATLYICPAGKSTIGYGHVIRNGEDFSTPISEAEAANLLAEDIKIPEAAIDRFVEADLNQNQFDALVSFIYNIGVGVFEKSTLLRLLNAENFTAAADQFDRWVYANGNPVPGLVTRRKAEKNLFCA